MNAALIFMSIFAATSISGLPPGYFAETNFDSELYSKFSSFLAVGETTGFILISLWALDFRNWFSLAVSIERNRERNFKWIIILISSIVAVLQVLAYNSCFDWKKLEKPFNSYSFLNFANGRNDIYYLKEDMDDLAYKFKIHDSNCLNPSRETFNYTVFTYSYNQYVNISTFKFMEGKLWLIEQECPNPCDEQASTLRIGFAVMAFIYGLYKVATYDGAVSNCTPSANPIFLKMKIPLLCGWLPKFWITSSEVVS
jgi:hypothetical protein